MVDSLTFCNLNLKFKKNRNFKVRVDMLISKPLCFDMKGEASYALMIEFA